MLRILVLHGPNLNWLGRREPEVYGDQTLDDIHQKLDAAGQSLGIRLQMYQSNHEGALIDRLQAAVTEPGELADGILLNPGALAHYSLALADAVRSIRPIPVVEIHLSNTAAREEYRTRALVGAACMARVEGWGAASYLLGLHGLVTHLRSAALAE